MTKNKFIVFFTSSLFAASILAGAANAVVNVTTHKQAIHRNKIHKTSVTIAARQAIKSEMVKIHKLPRGQRQAKIQELRAKYPNFFKTSSKANGLVKLRKLAKTNTQLAADLQGLKGLSKDQRRARLQEIKQKYL